MNHACRTFLRDLGIHVAEPTGGAGAGSHADACASCAERLRAARAHAAWLRQRPAVPAALRERDLFEAVLARASDEAEAGPIGRLLHEHLPVTAEREHPWPVPCADGEAEPGAPADAAPTAVPPMAVDSASVPAWVWQRVKAEILAEVGSTRRVGLPVRRRASRAMTLAGGLVLVAAGAVISASLFLGQPGEPEPEIVMRRLPAAPLVDYSPTAILRHGRGE